MVVPVTRNISISDSSPTNNDKSCIIFSAKEPFTSLPIVHPVNVSLYLCLKTTNAASAQVLVRPNTPTHLGAAQSTAVSAHPAFVQLPYPHLLTSVLLSLRQLSSTLLCPAQLRGL
ncbi:MAG: hypothetical protein BYD32DRAFT_439909 [Podila humilis]|nr:MAG: hypothetical protein BYD32DRAFT_439909 [Podila humilis]